MEYFIVTIVLMGAIMLTMAVGVMVSGKALRALVVVWVDRRAVLRAAGHSRM